MLSDLLPYDKCACPTSAPGPLFKARWGTKPESSISFTLCNHCSGRIGDKIMSNEEIAQYFKTPEYVPHEASPIASPLTPKEQRYIALADTVASTVINKQKAYGDSFGKSGAIMVALYPDGIPPSKMEDALTVVRIVDKLFRIATDRDALGESPWNDINGYALLAMERIEAKRLVAVKAGEKYVNGGLDR